jgi:hypothetical protein
MGENQRFASKIVEFKQFDAKFSLHFVKISHYVQKKEENKSLGRNFQQTKLWE